MEGFARIPKRILIDDRLSPRAKALYAALDDDLDKRRGGGRVSPSLSRLAARVGCSVRYATELIHELERAGYVVVERSAGVRSTYVLPLAAGGEIKGETPEVQFRGTPEVQFRGTPEVQFRGSENSPYKGFQEQEKNKKAPPSPRDRHRDPDRPIGRPTAGLFDDVMRRQFCAEVDYRLREIEELEGVPVTGWAPWWGELMFSFFLSRWRIRPEDALLVVQWARRLVAAIPDLQRPEVDRAVRFVQDAPTPPRQFSRADQFDRIKAKILSVRARPMAGPVAIGHVSPSPAPVPARVSANEWDSATEEEREAVRADLRAIGLEGSRLFDARCRVELATRRAKARGEG